MKPSTDTTTTPPTDVLGQQWLIMGDINSGKTTRCRQWLQQLCEQGLGARIAVLDLAPHIPPAMAQARGLAGAGGYLLPPANSGVLDLRTQLHAPRLSSSTEADAEAKAAQNAAAINALLQRLPQARRQGNRHRQQRAWPVADLQFQQGSEGDWVTSDHFRLQRIDIARAVIGMTPLIRMQVDLG